MNDTTIPTTSTRPRREPAQSPLRIARLAKGLSQADLAARAGLSPGWVSLLERSPAFLTPRTARALAQALSVPEAEIQP